MTIDNHWVERSTKRQLSVVEKSSLRPTHVAGKALVMPGSPRTEIEELCAVGFDPSKVHGIEVAPDIANALYNFYWDANPIHLGEIGEWLEGSRNQWSYMHYDYCGHFKHEEVRGLQAGSGKLADLARVRVSVYCSRKKDNQVRFERQVLQRILVPLLTQARQFDHIGNAEMWTEYIEAIDAGAFGVNHCVATVLFFSHTLGIDVWEYADACTLNKDAPLPRALGSHVPASVRSFNYNEAGISSLMNTTWIDFVPIGSTISQELTLLELAKFMALITIPAPIFNPEHYTYTGDAIDEPEV